MRAYCRCRCQVDRPHRDESARCALNRWMWRVVGGKRARRGQIISVPWETPGGGTFGFPRIGLAPAPKTWPKTVFETKILIYFVFFEGERIWSNRTDPVPERFWTQALACVAFSLFCSSFRAGFRVIQRTRKRRFQ